MSNNKACLPCGVSATGAGGRNALSPHGVSLCCVFFPSSILSAGHLSLGVKAPLASVPHTRGAVDKGDSCCCFNVVLNLSHTQTSHDKVPKTSNRWTFSSPALPVAVAPESVGVDRGGGRVENHRPIPRSAFREDTHFTGK